jgi:hypothetical protein
LLQCPDKEKVQRVWGDAVHRSDTGIYDMKSVVWSFQELIAAFNSEVKMLEQGEWPIIDRDSQFQMG